MSTETKRKSVVLCSSSQTVGVSLRQSADESFWFVAAVEPGSLACNADVRAGDVLQSINFVEVKTEVDVQRELSQRAPVVLQFVSSLPVETLPQPLPRFATVDDDDVGQDAVSQESIPVSSVMMMMPKLSTPPELVQEEEDEEEQEHTSDVKRARTTTPRVLTTQHAKEPRDFLRVSLWLSDLFGAPVSLLASSEEEEDYSTARPVVFYTVQHDDDDDEEQEEDPAIVACCIGYLLRTPLRGNGNGSSKVFFIQELVVAPQQSISDDSIDDDEEEDDDVHQTRVGSELVDGVVEHARTSWRECTEIQLGSDVSATEAHRFFIGKGMNITAFQLSMKIH